MTAYSLEVQNNSSGFTNFCMFQSPPDTNLGVQVETLAWFVEPAYPTTTVTFTWDVDYSFCFSQAGPLSPGVTFTASQVWSADPLNPVQQAVQLHHADNAYTFQRLPASQTRHPGNLYIEQGRDVPLREASVGIGMSGSGTHAVEAQPNLHLIFTPHPRYWLVAGDFAHGEVLDMAELSNPIEIDYYGAQTIKKLTYTMDNLLTPIQ
jgi:rhizosphere induced protein